MKATLDWHSVSGADFSAGSGRTGQAHLQHYTATWSEWGEGPPLVMIPGLAGGYELLGPLAKILARDFRVISYQLRGEEDPFALRQQFGLSDMVEDLQEFLLEMLGLECPILFGVSFGGLLAMQYATRYPCRVSRLILQGVGARYERSLLQRIAGSVLSNYPLPTDNAFVNQFFNLLFGGREHDELFHFVTRQCWQTDQSVMAHRFRLVEQFDLAARLPRINASTLILSGDRDMLVSEKSLNVLKRGIPSAKHVHLPGCGHLAFATHPERVAEEVRTFTTIPAKCPESPTA